MTISIPKNLLTSIESSKNSEAFLNLIHTYIRNIEDRMAHNNIEIFFPDYTDHSTNHIQTVLDLTDFLIADGSQNRPDSWQYFTAEDSVALILSVLIHDIGMHLTGNEGLALINNLINRITRTNDLSWPNAWEHFISEASRWDTRKLKDVYGFDFSDRIKNRKIIEIPSSDPANWDGFDKRLIGEFLRLHHARIAHEVAVFGLPITRGDLLPGNDLKIPSLEQIPSLPDLVGFIARSHCMSLSDTLAYLESKHFNTRVTNNIHAVYLMCLLRIADILNIHAERAPGGIKALLKRKTVCSRREWETHQSIENVRLDTEPDPEAVAVDVSPESVKGIQIYFRIKEWLTLLQEELNGSWAVLGQVYGRYARLQNLWLQVRRVNSNIFTESFRKSLPFYPNKAGFDSKNPDFIKLLVAPLYGDRPEIGIRELLQNAIDAVRELDSVLSRNAEAVLPYTRPKLHNGTTDADILLNLCSRNAMESHDDNTPSDWQYWFEIRDRGVGMAIDVVTEYFLKAGSTFRSSDHWQKHFTHNGDSLLLRSGRFGVGVLAGFLIGDIVQVITKHYNAKQGLEFKAALDETNINIRKCDCPYGTTIRVKCSQELYEEWAKEIGHAWWPQWFHLRTPIIRWCINGRSMDTDNDDESEHQHIPDQREELPPYWRRIHSPDFSDIHWTYEKKYQKMLFCNGIEIPVEPNRIGWEKANASFRRHEKFEYRYEWPIPDIPTVSVFDPNCNLNINLARDGLTTDTLPFSKELQQSVLLDVIAHSIVCGPDRCVSNKVIANYQKKGHLAYSLDLRLGITQWVYTESGFTLADPYLLIQLQPKRMFLIYSRPNFRWGPSIKLGPKDVLIAYKSNLEMNDQFSDWNWPLDKKSLRPKRLFLWDSPFRDITIIGARVLITKKYASEMLKTSDSWLNIENADYITHDKNRKLFIIESESKLPHISESALPDLMSNRYIREHLLDMGLIAELYIDEKQPNLKPSELAGLWLEKLHAMIVPYRLEDREALIKNAQENLKQYVSCWKRDNLHEKALREQAGNKDNGAY